MSPVWNLFSLWMCVCLCLSLFSPFSPASWLARPVCHVSDISLISGQNRVQFSATLSSQEGRRFWIYKWVHICLHWSCTGALNCSLMGRNGSALCFLFIRLMDAVCGSDGWVTGSDEEGSRSGGMKRVEIDKSKRKSVWAERRRKEGKNEEGWVLL